MALRSRSVRQRTLASVAVIAWACGLGACTTTVFDELESFADEMCACTDLACSDATQAKFVAYTAKNPIVQADKKSEARMIAAISRMTKCRLDALPLPNPTGAEAKRYTGRAAASLPLEPKTAEAVEPAEAAP